MKKLFVIGLIITSILSQTVKADCVEAYKFELAKLEGKQSVIKDIGSTGALGLLLSTVVIGKSTTRAVAKAGIYGLAASILLLVGSSIKIELQNREKEQLYYLSKGIQDSIGRQELDYYLENTLKRAGVDMSDPQKVYRIIESGNKAGLFCFGGQVVTFSEFIRYIKWQTSLKN